MRSPPAPPARRAAGLVSGPLRERFTAFPDGGRRTASIDGVGTQGMHVPQSVLQLAAVWPVPQDSVC